MMATPELLQIDPAILHLPGSRRNGADPLKVQRQFAQHGISVVGMPPIEVKCGLDNELVIYNGVTRATRAPDTHQGFSFPSRLPVD